MIHNTRAFFLALLCCLAGDAAASAVPLKTLVLGGSLAHPYLSLVGWSANATSTLATPPNFDNILVSALTVDADTVDVVFEANNELTLTGADLFGDFIDLALSFTVNVNANGDRRHLKSVALVLESYTLTPSSPTESFVYIEEYVYNSVVDHDALDPAANALAQMKVEADPGQGSVVTHSSGVVPGLRDTVFVYKNTLSNAAQGQTAGITRFVQRFTTEVPEPAVTWLLLWGALPLLAQRRRGRRI